MNLIKRFVIRSALGAVNHAELTRMLWQKNISGLAFDTECGVIIIPTNSRSIVNEFIRGKYFGKTVLQNFLDLGPKSARLLNIGANVGTSAKYFKSRDAYKQIDCFEPDPENFRFLSMNMSGCDGVVLHNEAVGKRSGSLQLYRNPKSVGRHSFMTNFGMGSISVPVRSIDELIGPNEEIDLFIDVEGWEIEVIRGAVNSLRRCNILAVEWNGQLYSGEDRDAAVNALAEAGFSKIVELGGGSTIALANLALLRDQRDIAFLR